MVTLIVSVLDYNTIEVIRVCTITSPASQASNNILQLV